MQEFFGVSEISVCAGMAYARGAKREDVVASARQSFMSLFSLSAVCHMPSTLLT